MTMTMTVTVLRALFVLFSFREASSATKVERSLTIQNNSGHRVALNWIHPDTGEASLISDPDILTGADFVVDSFVSHKFEVRELPARKTGECETPENCKVVFFTVNDNAEQLITISKQYKITHEDHKTVARKGATSLVQDCKALAQQQLQQIDAVADDVLSELASCMEAQVAAQLKSVAEDIAFSATTRKKMAGFYENYTCADDDLPSSQSKENTTWYDKRREMDLDVKIMLDRPASRIHVVEEFITQEECKAMEEAAAPQLHRAVVADGAGGHEVSENRKAMQAGIKVPWSEEDQGHPIATISRRVYDYTNNVLNLNIDEHGQEDLMSIQYFGRGSNETKPDQYMPHCDGECTGDPHKYGNRMATMVMYCTMPSRGGATNFRNSGLHVRAKKGSAVFFSYINPETRIMDSGFTEHSGCPVVEGEKKIVTQWVRYGVTTEVPWTAYNSLGILVKDAVDQD